MTERFHFADVLEARTPRELTRRSFWRTRELFDISTETPWAAFTGRPHPDAGQFGEDGRDALKSRLEGFILGFRGPRLYYRIRNGDWRSGRFLTVFDISRDKAIEAARGLEHHSLLYSGEGDGSKVQIIETFGDRRETVGRDSIGQLQPGRMLELYLRSNWRMPDAANLDCYLFSLPRSWATYHLYMKIGRDELHQKVRKKY